MPYSGATIMKKRKRDAHKGDYGHVFVLAGSRGLTGAAALCANAVLRSGAGLATLGIPASLSLVMARKLTEVMTCALAETGRGTLALKARKEILRQANDADIVILGPGLSQNKDTQRLIREIIVNIRRPVVLDADALNAICTSVTILKKMKRPYIITPHPGEMSRLIG